MAGTRPWSALEAGAPLLALFAALLIFFHAAPAIEAFEIAFSRLHRPERSMYEAFLPS
jgi:hypothetical protein